MVSMALGLLAFLVPLQMILGDQHGLNTLHYQPSKLAAIEGRWDTRSHAPLTLFAVPDMAGERNRFAVEIPELGSLVLTHHVDGVVPGLKDVAPENRPPVLVEFFAFRTMVASGCLMLAIVVYGTYLRMRRRIIDAIWFLRACEFASCLGFIAVLAGWVTTEVGRQPWTVFGLLRTQDSISPSLTGSDVALSLSGLQRCVPHHLLGGVPTHAAADTWRTSFGSRYRASAVQCGTTAAGHRSRTFNRERSMSNLLPDFVPIWTFILGFGILVYVLLDGFDLGVGILYAFAPPAGLAHTHHEFHCANLGRERNLAGAQRRGTACRLPPGLRDFDTGTLFSHPADSDRPHIPRGRF